MLEIDGKADNIIHELGLNFNPRTELEIWAKETERKILDIVQYSTSIDYSVNAKHSYEIYDITETVKNQWLNYYGNNQYWILKFHCWRKISSSEERRPNASLILGAMSVIEPRLKNYLIPLYGLDGSGEEIIKVLNLDFRPQTELEKFVEEKRLIQDATLIQDVNIIGLLSEDPEYREAYEGLNQIREQIKQENLS
jgi:hypothetical protein